MRHRCSTGLVIYLILQWQIPIFLAAIDCESVCYWSRSLQLHNYSGNDPAGVCNVESVQKGPLWPAVHFCATGHSLPRFRRNLWFR